MMSAMNEDLVDYRPEVYVAFRDSYPGVSAALDALGVATSAAGPLDAHTAALVRLGVAIGSLSEGAVRSNVRKAIGQGASPEEVRHVALLATPTRGFPATVAALGWIEDVLGEGPS
jgi:4-carboxymuconolactone decarboxylase